MEEQEADAFETTFYALLPEQVVLQETLINQAQPGRRSMLFYPSHNTQTFFYSLKATISRSSPLSLHNKAQEIMNTTVTRFLAAIP